MYRKGPRRERCRPRQRPTTTTHDHGDFCRAFRRSFIAERNRALCRRTQHNGLKRLSPVAHNYPPLALPVEATTPPAPPPFPWPRRTIAIASLAESTSASYCPTVSLARFHHRRHWVTTDEGFIAPRRIPRTSSVSPLPTTRQLLRHIRNATATQSCCPW